MPKNKTRKVRKGAGHTQSRSRYPLLPESPSPPSINTSNKGLKPPNKDSEARQKRINATLKVRRIALGSSLWSNLFGRKYNNYKPNKNGSYFLPNKNKGFKPPKPES
jgi:hypothetical protein